MINNEVRIDRNIFIEHADIGFRNFSGAEGMFNVKGRRNFCVFFEDEVARELADNGWRIKELKPKNEDDDPVPYMQVTVKYGAVPPKIYLVTSRGKTLLDEETVGLLDWAEIENVDLVIRPYDWTFSGRSGRSAYVKSMYVTIREDEFELKYRDCPDSAVGALRNSRTTDADEDR